MQSRPSMPILSNFSQFDVKSLTLNRGERPEPYPVKNLQGDLSFSKS
jgi:hypothetical protein